MKPLLLVICTAFLSLYSCMPPPETLWYTGAPEIPVDTAALKNKVIVIDPGHGGIYNGAVGKAGMKEKDINLRVAWRLFFKLDSAGAQPIMTRFVERDFFTDTTKTRNLRADLAERMRRANLAGADLFISLHHNASYNRGHNATKTFYAMKDIGASFEAANYIHHQLVRSLKIEFEEVDPGNYFVLRNSNLPALLGEPSYLSNSLQESILVSDSAVETEATAYFRGISSYFAAGPPKVKEIQPSGKTFDYPKPLLWAKINPGKTGISGTGVFCTIDSQKTETSFSGNNIITFRPFKPLRNGWHVAAVTLRSRNGVTSVTVKTRFKTELNPAYIKSSAYPSVITADSRNLIKVSAEVFDSFHRPVADSIPVRFQSSGGSWLIDTVLTFRGKASNYLQVYGKKNIDVKISTGHIEKTLLLTKTGKKNFSCGFVKDALTGKPVRNAGVFSGAQVPEGLTDRNGFFSIKKELCPPWIKKQGYIPLKYFSNNFKCSMMPVDNGVFLNKRILIDPECGGEESGPHGRDGLRAADLNMVFAEKLYGYLNCAGADVRFTRKGNRTRTLYQRVETSINGSFDIVISVGYDSLPNHACKLYHYTYSRNGKRICREIAKSIKSIMGRNKLQGYYGMVNTILQQTPCPAIRISPSSVYKPDTSFVSTNYLAYSVYRGLAGYFQKKSDNCVLKLMLPDSVTAGGKVNFSVLDNYLELPISNGNVIKYQGLNNGIHQLSVFNWGRKLWSGKISVDTKTCLIFLSK